MYNVGEVILKVEDVSLSYDKPILRDINFEIHNITRPDVIQGQIVSLIGRSGIGKTRKDRRLLQRLISDYERKNNPALTRSIEKIIGGQGPHGDLLQGVMEYLNNYKTQDSVKRNAEALTESLVEFLLEIRKDADGITAEILKN